MFNPSLVCNELADRVDMAGWDALKPTRRKVEDCDSGWFMDRLALAWGDLLEKGEDPRNPRLQGWPHRRGAGGRQGVRVAEASK